LAPSSSRNGVTGPRASDAATQTRAPLADIAEQLSTATTELRVQQGSVADLGATAGASRPTPLISLVGSVVFSVLGAALQTLSGAPVLPAGSTVTVRTSTLTLATGQTVQANWYFPENADSSTRLIYLQHGFLATAPMYSYTAATLAEQTDSILVAPTLSSNLFVRNADWIGGTPEQQAVADLFAGDRGALTESASTAAGHPVTLPAKFVLVGHSLGGMLVTAAAADMVDNGAIGNLEGVVLLDSVDFNGAIPSALDQLSGANYRPVYDISSERYVWNLDGLVGDELSAARPGQFNGVMLVGGRHIDALQGGNPVLQLGEYIVAGFSQPQNIDAVKTLAVGWINDMFAGTHDGIYADPQETIQIPTSAGIATAVALPFTSTQEIQATPWDGLAKVILDFLFQFAVFQPDPAHEPLPVEA
jgi:pimeloyl-ACP methyl ester carboxylesterase